MSEQVPKSEAGAVRSPAGPELKHRETVLLEMGKALRALSMYPAKHPQRANLLGQAYGAVQVVVNMLGELSYTVARNAFGYSDHKLGAELPLIRELAQEMHLRQVKSFTLKRELSLHDFSNFLEIMLEDPDQFRKGRFIEQWIQGHSIQTVWINEIDFSKLATMAGPEAAPEEGPADQGPETHHLFELMDLLAKAKDPEQFAQLLREAEVFARPLLEAEQFAEAWRLVEAIARQGDEKTRPGPAGEMIRPLALRTVRVLVKGKFLTYLLERYTRPEETEREALHLVFHELGPALGDETMNLLGRAEAMTAYRPLLDLLLELGAQARMALEPHLKSDNVNRVRKAAFLLGELREKAAAGALKAALDHPEVKVRREVVRALSRLRSLEASRALAGVLASEKDLETRMVILQSLGESKDLSAVPPLLKMLEQLALREDTLALREAVIEVLGKIGSREALPVLIKILSQWSPFKRDLVLKEKQKAAYALGRLGGESAMQALARYARGGNDPLSLTCTAVLEALLKNDGKPVDNLEGLPK